MNLNEERNYQKLMDTLDALNLSEENRKLAEEYFSQGNEARNLARVRLQDFSRLSEEERKKSVGYVEHLRKRGKKEELAHYVRFAAAVGGSTAGYVLLQYGWSLADIGEYLLPEQAAAIYAERIVWSPNALYWRNIKELSKEAAKDLKTICRAMELCCHQYNNAKVLLAAVYLHENKHTHGSKNPFKELFGKKIFPNDSEEGKVVEFLEKNLTDSLPAVFQSPGLKEEEQRRLQNYVTQANPYGKFPKELLSLTEGRQWANYLLTLLAGCAFLAQDHSKCFLAFLQVMAALNPEGTMDACRQLSEDSWFREHTGLMERILPVEPGFFIRWYLKNRIHAGLKRMAAQYPEIIKEQVQGASITTEDYRFLAEQVKQAAPELYQELSASLSDRYGERLAEELTEGMNYGRMEAKQYLLGEAPLSALYPFVNSWRGNYGYYYRDFRTIQSIGENGGQLYRRALVLKALEMQGGFFTCYYLPNGEAERRLEEKVEELIGILEQETVPIQYQADAMDGIYSSYYAEKSKNLFLDTAVKAMARRLPAHREEFHMAVKNCTVVGRDICLRVLDEDWRQEKEWILACALDGSRQVRNTMAMICAGHREWEPEIRNFLKSGKSQERELAVQIMKNWGADGFQKELKEALEREKSKKVRELLQDCLGMARETDNQTADAIQTAEKQVIEILKGGKKRKVAWAYETPFCQVHKRDGSLAAEEYLQAILVAYADLSVPGVSKEAAKLAGELEEKEFSRYVMELFDKWLQSGAEAKKKWVLYAASIHGGEGIVPLFYKQIQDWPQHARGALAAEAVKALALNQSSEALLLVDQISRKFKFRQVKTAAAQALDYAASSLGISRDQLEDRIVPTLGFGENMDRTFDYGTRSFRVYLTPALELEIFDEDGRRLKNMPAPGKRDEEEKASEAYTEFKQLKKQLKTVTANQKLRLEQALTAERLWKTDQWKALFVKNPVMHQFAIGLIWGIYEEGRLKETFRYMEDGSFNTKDEEEFALPEEGMAGLVHPIELSEQELAAWKEQLSDYEVVQPIEQLERPVYRVTEEEKGKQELTRFGGKILNGLSLSGKLQGMGWYRGSVQDAGVYTTFYREDGALGVELEFSGSYVGDENEEVTVYGAGFYKAGTVKRGSYVYDTIQQENRYALDQVSPRYFSEMVLQLERATASSQEQLAYPDCKK